MALSLLNQGAIALKTGHFQEAKDLCQKQLPLMRDIGDRYLVTAGLICLGHACYMLNEYHTAWQTLREGLEIAVTIKAPPLIAQATNQIARLLYHLRRFESSFAMFTISQSYPIISTHHPGTPENLYELLVENLTEEKRNEIQNTWQDKTLDEVTLFMRGEFDNWLHQANLNDNGRSPE